MSGICGQMMMAASTTSIGTSMIMVSLSAYLSRTPATAQEINRRALSTRRRLIAAQDTTVKDNGAMS